MSVEITQLQQLELFRDCSEVDLETVLARLSPAVVDAGTVLMREGEAADGFLVIVSGTAVVSRVDDGHEHEIGDAGAGSIVGELALLRGSARRATVTAREPLVGLVGDLDAFGTLLDVPGVGPRITRAAAQRLVAEVRPVPVTLRRGIEVVLRPILPTDRGRLTEALDHLSPEAHRQRFFSTAPLSERMIDYLVDLDYLNHFAWIVLPAQHPEGKLVASARYVRTASDPQAAELAFGVGEEHRNLGIATLLLGALAIPARQSALQRFVANVLSDNRSMRAVFDKVGARWERGEPGVVTTEFDIAAAAGLIEDAQCAAALERSSRQISDAAGVALATPGS
jgi:CRP-like cAMP-binding protein